MSKPPFLFRGGLSGRIFIATRYRQMPDGRTAIDEKFDVTDQFNELAWGYYPQEGRRRVTELGSDSYRPPTRPGDEA